LVSIPASIRTRADLRQPILAPRDNAARHRAAPAGRAAAGSVSAL
jgi:hypothetical protein